MSSEFYLDQFLKGVNSLPNELTGTLEQMKMLDRSIEFEKVQAKAILEVVLPYSCKQKCF
jgi:hypothetical protein